MGLDIVLITDAERADFRRVLSGLSQYHLDVLSTMASRLRLGYDITDLGGVPLLLDAMCGEGDSHPSADITDDEFLAELDELDEGDEDDEHADGCPECRIERMREDIDELKTQVSHLAFAVQGIIGKGSGL